MYCPGADPGFPVGGGTRFGGCGPPTQVLIGENVCENERIGSHGEHALENFVCRSGNVLPLSNNLTACFNIRHSPVLTFIKKYCMLPHAGALLCARCCKLPSLGLKHKGTNLLNMGSVR